MNEDESNWKDFPAIPEFLIKNLINEGFETPFAVQTAVINAFFSTDQDLAIGFPTGSGKTLSYLIPIISSLYQRVVPRVRALIVVPNRELAKQVFKVAEILINGCDLSISVLTTNLHAGPKNKNRSADILITTALSLSSYLIEIDNKLLSTVEIVILDEGDVILEQPIENWIQHVSESLKSSFLPSKLTIPMSSFAPKDRIIRRILCSATLSRNAKQSEDFEMNSPLMLVSSDKSKYVVPHGVKEQFVLTENSDKIAALLKLCDHFNFILCFVSTTKRCVTLASIMKRLKSDLSVIEFSASSSYSEKKKSFDSGQEGQNRLIIATDALARGIDLPFIDAVINFDTPASSKTYIHRMGRTARGGATGTCITFILEGDLVLYREIISKIDGSSPEEITIDFRKYKTQQYHDEIKKFMKLKAKIKINPKIKTLKEIAAVEEEEEVNEEKKEEEIVENGEEYSE